MCHANVGLDSSGIRFWRCSIPSQKEIDVDVNEMMTYDWSMITVFVHSHNHTMQVTTPAAIMTTKTMYITKYTRTVLDSRLASREILRDCALLHQLSNKMWTPCRARHKAVSFQCVYWLWSNRLPQHQVIQKSTINNDTSIRQTTVYRVLSIFMFPLCETYRPEQSPRLPTSYYQ